MHGFLLSRFSVNKDLSGLIEELNFEVIWMGLTSGLLVFIKNIFPSIHVLTCQVNACFIGMPVLCLVGSLRILLCVKSWLFIG